MTQSNTSYTFDDILLVPKYSEVQSRLNIDLSTKFTRRYSLKLPIVASPMDTVCDANMAIALGELGGVGVIHRFMSIDEQSKQVRTTWTFIHGGAVYEFDRPIAAAVGANGDYLERAVELVKYGANVILIDVAHGHHVHVKTAIEKLKSELPSHVDIIAGNVATSWGAIDLGMWGADAVRVGVGGGSLCTTRIKTGFGVPNLSAIYDARAKRHSQYVDLTIPIIADGGIRNSGDIAKALAFGANSVMLGSLLAGTKESPGTILEDNKGHLFKKYRGAASLETKLAHGQASRNVEGESTIVPFKGDVSYIVNDLMDGLRSALSYGGANNLTEFHPEFVHITSSGLTESKPHLL